MLVCVCFVYIRAQGLVVGAISIVDPATESVLDCRSTPQNTPVLAPPMRVRCTGAEFVLLVEKVATALAMMVDCAEKLFATVHVIDAA